LEEVSAKLNSLKSQEERIDWLEHVYGDGGFINEIEDDGKFVNHSETPNSSIKIGTDPMSSYALRDIKAGEEIIEDYGIYEEPEWFQKLIDEIGAKRDYYVNKHYPVVE
jgi:SET domain-containing protein